MKTIENLYNGITTQDLNGVGAGNYSVTTYKDSALNLKWGGF